MSRDKTLAYELKIKDQATQALKRMEGTIGRLDKQVLKLGTTSAVSSTKSVGAFKAIGAAIAAIGVAQLGRDVLQFGTDFERSSVQIAGLGPEIREQIGAISESARQMAATFGASLADVSAAQFDYLSATQDVQGQSVAVAEALKLSAAGGTSAAVAMDALTTIMGNFSIEGSQAAAVSEALFRSQQKGKATMEQIAASIGNVATSARAAGVSYQEMLGALSAVTAGGLGGAKTQIGATSTARLFDAIAKAGPKVIASSRAMAAEAGEVGFEFSKAQLAADGLARFLERLSRVTQGDAIKLADLGIATEAAKGTQILLKDGAIATTAAIDDQARAAVELDDAFAVYEDTMAARMDRLNALWGEAKLALFEEFVGPAKGGFDQLSADIDTVRDVVKRLAGGVKLVGTAIVHFFDLLQVGLATTMTAFFKVGEAIIWLGNKINFFTDETVRSMRFLADSALEELNAEIADLGENADVMIESWDDLFGERAQKNVKKTGEEIAKVSEELADANDLANSLLESMQFADPQAAASSAATPGAAADTPSAFGKFDKELRAAVTEARLRAAQSLASDDDAELLAISSRFSKVRNRILAEESLTQDERESLIIQANRRASIEFKAVADRRAKDQRDTANEANDLLLEDRTAFDEEMQQVASDAAFSLAQVGRTETQQAIADVNRRYDELIAAAQEFGTETVAIEKARQDELARVRKEARAKVSGEISPLEKEIEGLQRIATNNNLAAARAVDGVFTSLGDGFFNVIRRSQSAGEAVWAFGESVLDTFARIASDRLAASLVTSAIGALGSSTDYIGDGAKVPAGESVQFFADGGVVNRPTRAVIGEAGPEAVVPLSGGRSVPVELRGGGGSGVSIVVQQTIQVSATDAASVDRLFRSRRGFIREEAAKGVTEALGRDPDLRERVRRAARGN